MDSSLKIRDTSSWTMFVFGVLALLLGLIGLIRPELLLSLLGFSLIDRPTRNTGDHTIVFMTASSMASFNMGVYYTLAALNDMNKFFAVATRFSLYQDDKQILQTVAIRKSAMKLPRRK